MESEQLDRRLQAIETRLSAAESKRKDPWDKFNILGALLIPASITVVGYLYSTAMKDAEIAKGAELAERQEAIAKINARVGQAPQLGHTTTKMLYERYGKFIRHRTRQDGNAYGEVLRHAMERRGT